MIKLVHSIGNCNKNKGNGLPLTLLISRPIASTSPAVPFQPLSFMKMFSRPLSCKLYKTSRLCPKIISLFSSMVKATQWRDTHRTVYLWMIRNVEETLMSTRGKAAPFEQQFAHRSPSLISLTHKTQRQFWCDLLECGLHKSLPKRSMVTCTV